MRRGTADWVKLVTIAVTSSFLLTACTVSAPGGILGAILSLLIGSSLFIGLATTSSGCVEVGPCLSPPLPPPMEAGPMGGAQDSGPTDAEVGPCLQPTPQEMGTPEAGTEPPMGPCLSAPSPERDGSAMMDREMQEAPPGDAAGVDRKAAMARVLARGGLPDDVIQRLRRDGEPS